MDMDTAEDAFVVEGSEAAGFVADVVPADLLLLSRDALGTREQVEAEIDAMLAQIRDFYRMEPDEVMRYCAGFTARCTELEVQLYRAEGKDRSYQRVRTMQVDKVLAELDRQFRLASRLIELRRQDLETLRGAP